MLLFCPVCSNALIVARSVPNDEFPGGQNGLECRSCPYQFLIKDRVYERTEFKRKEVEDVIDDKDALANADKTDAQCPREGCDGSEAFFYQVQIRSADEPMTTFYKCTICGQRWKEN